MNIISMNQIALLLIGLIFQSYVASAQVKVTQDGDVGIGTDSPTAKLLVKGSGDRILKLFNSSNAEILTALDNGNIGLGYTVPNQRLTVSGNIQLYGGIDQRRYIIMNGGSSGRQILTIQAGAGSNTFGGAINLYGNAHGDHPGDVAIGLSSNGSSSFRINTSGLDEGTNRFIVTNSGNVGIGLTNPSTTLEVNGTIRSGDGGHNTFLVQSKYGLTGLCVMDYSTWGSKYCLGLLTRTNSSSGGMHNDRLWVFTTSGISIKSDQLENSQKLDLSKTNSIEAIRITNDANIGLGINNPAEKLHINGNVKATSFIAAGGQIWPDYVFQNYFSSPTSINPDHSLMPLGQLREYIRTYYHLPGIPSLQDVKDNGMNIDVGETAVKNLEKIEELTLYAIEANDQIIALKAENNILREELQKQIRALETKNEEMLKNNLNQDQKIKQLYQMITQLTAEQSKVSVN